MIVSPKLDYFIKADGRSKLFIYLYHSPTRTKAKIATDIYIKPSEWTGREVDRKFPQASFLNPKIKQIVFDIEKLATNNELSAPELKQLYESPKVNFTPQSYFRHYIELCKNGEILKKRSKEQMTAGYLKALGTAASAFEDYPARWDQLNESFFDKYVTHLRSKGFLQNTIAKYVKYTVIVMNHARRKGIWQGEQIDYHIQSEKPQKIRLTPEEVEKIARYDLLDWPHLKAEQERFIVAYSLLVRFSDSIAINEKNIIQKGNKHYLSAFTQKSRKEILLPLKPEVYKILKRNGFKLQSSNSKSNEKLKKLGLLAGITEKVTITEFRNGKKTEKSFKKYQLLETHTTRRSAARNLFDAGMDPHIIMTLGGWSTLKQLLDYIDIDLDYAAQKASEHPFFQ